MKSMVFLRNALSTANYLCYTRSVPEELIKNKVAFETQKKEVINSNFLMLRFRPAIWQL